MTLMRCAAGCGCGGQTERGRGGEQAGRERAASHNKQTQTQTATVGTAVAGLPYSPLGRWSALSLLALLLCLPPLSLACSPLSVCVHLVSSLIITIHMHRINHQSSIIIDTDRDMIDDGVCAGWVHTCTHIICVRMCRPVPTATA